MTEQEKREKVIKGLKHCIGDNCSGDKWYECEYSGHGCIDALLEDTLALLKAQEPHIVTIADYENNPIVDKDGNLAVWRESRHFNGIAYHEDGWIVLNRDRVEGWFNSEMIRFWTSRPTDEQRAAAKWP